MHKLLEKLQKDHRNLRRVLDLLSSQLDRLFAGDESNFDLKIELMEYIETYADLGHHPLEDRIYEIGLKRSKEKRELLKRLGSQHSNLISLTRKFRHSLENVLQGGVMTRNELEVEGREYIALQRLHIDLEENEAFPLLDTLLTEEDWKQVTDHMPSHDDPVFDQPDQLRFTQLLLYLEQVEKSG